MNASALTNLDGYPEYTQTNMSGNTPMIHPTNVDSTTKSMTMVVQNPFENLSLATGHMNTSSFLPRPVSASSPIYINNPTGRVPMVLRYPSRPPPRLSQVIMSQQSPLVYDPSVLQRINGHQIHYSSPADNILNSLLQTKPQINSEVGFRSQTIPMIKMPKQRQKRKEKEKIDEVTSKSPRKRKKKGSGAEKSLEYSLQQLRNLPMLTPLEPLMDINMDELSSSKKHEYQGEFGDILLGDINDYYRSYRQASFVPSTKLERHYRLCSKFLDQPPSLPSPPLSIDSAQKLIELTKDDDDGSIISTSTLADDDDDRMNDIQADNDHLLQTLSSMSGQQRRSLSPLLKSNENVFNQLAEIPKDDQLLGRRPEKVSVTLTLTTEAANDLQSVIAAVTDLLKTAYPSTFDVHQTLDKKSDCISLPTSSPILGINRGASVYKTGAETRVSIQSLIDTQPKNCRYCSKNLTSENILKKRPSELYSNAEPFVYFCNEQCFNTFTTHSQQQQQVPLTIPKNEPVDIKYSSKRLEETLNGLKGVKRWKRWDPNLPIATFLPPPNDDDIEELITNIQIPLSSNAKHDERACVFCDGIGDMSPNGPGRLLNLNIGRWCHLNCAFWSDEVHEAVSGSLMCVEQALTRSMNIECVVCKQKGASLTCFYQRCSNTYHFICAIDQGCVFYQSKTMMCPTHASKSIEIDQILEDKSVCRRVWIDRDEIKQIQNYMIEDHEDKSYTLRIGSLILHNIGQLLPHQLQSSTFHNRNFIYPVGYSVTRFYWSMHQPNRRCTYNCSIIDIDNQPVFRIQVQETEQSQEFVASSAKAVWQKILIEIDSLRQRNNLVKMFPVFVKGEDFYGLTEPHITRLIESLPGVEMLQNYAFKYGRLQLFDMPLTVNPTGCARSEPMLRTHFRRHAQTLTSSHASRNTLPRTVHGAEATQISYVKQFVISKSTQYRKLKAEWRQNIYLAKSRIQGLGLFAARDLEKHTMVIEYIGELIRNEVANKREKLYEQHNRGIYMFRLDDDCVVDATVSGCLARYMNHSCEPNSMTEVVQIDKDSKIIIITNRRINKGEELMYDYKFDLEDDSKIPCLCGAANCRKWMN